jgi:WD40 repeat protein
VAFSRSGKIFASANADGTVRFWDVATWLPSREPLKGNPGITPLRLAFSADDKILGVAFADGSLQVWDVASRLRLAELSRGNAGAFAKVFVSGSRGACGMAFSEDGKLLASAAGDSVIQLWNVKSRLPLGPTLRGHAEAVCGLAFSPNGNFLASASADEAVRLWDVATRQTLGDFLKGPGSRREYLFRPDVAFSPDGKILAAASADGAVWLWDTDPRSWAARACSLANRNLSLSEWQQYLSPELPYRRTCPDLPDGEGASPPSPGH